SGRGRLPCHYPTVAATLPAGVRRVDEGRRRGAGHGRHPRVDEPDAGPATLHVLERVDRHPHRDTLPGDRLNPLRQGAGAVLVECLLQFAREHSGRDLPAEGDGNTAPVHHRDGAVTGPGLAVIPYEVRPVLNTHLPSEGDAAARHSLDVMHRAGERDLPRRAVVLARPVVPLAVDQVRRTSTPVLPV